MAAPRGALYVAPSSSPIAGQVFDGEQGTTQAYNRYLQANAKALGYRSYSDQKAARSRPFFRTIFQQELRGDRFGRRGQLTPQNRMTLNRLFAQFRGVDPNDRRVGGPLDRLLQALGRRTGRETWPVGETNARRTGVA